MAENISTTGTIDVDKLYRLKEARPYLGNPCTNTLYKLIGDGILDARKIGRSTVITGQSLKAAQGRLPAFVSKLA